MSKEYRIKGRCILCQHKCGHVFIGMDTMPKLVHECINKLEDGCGHADLGQICKSCRELVVTVIWQLAKGETVG